MRVLYKAHPVHSRHLINVNFHLPIISGSLFCEIKKDAQPLPTLPLVGVLVKESTFWLFVINYRSNPLISHLICEALCNLPGSFLTIVPHISPKRKSEVKEFSISQMNKGPGEAGYLAWLCWGRLAQTGLGPQLCSKLIASA